VASWDDEELEQAERVRRAAVATERRFRRVIGAHCVADGAGGTERHTLTEGRSLLRSAGACCGLFSVRTISRRFAASAAIRRAFEEGSDDEDEMCMLSSLIR
jgi:hypothetical protein